MTLFFYGFSVALGLALGFTTANAWVREHRNGRWSRRAIAIVVLVSAGFALLLGWGIDTFAAFAQLTESAR